MPRPIGVVQKPGLFEDLLVRLGVNRPVQPFTLDGDIVPVVLVESGISFVASPTPAYTVTDIFTSGVLTNPAIGIVLAETGPLPTGQYSVQITIYTEVAGIFDFAWRDATDVINLRAWRFKTSLQSPQVSWLTRLTIENINERFRIVNQQAPGAGNDIQALILAKI